MKKILFTVISLGILSCTNPSMEEGLAQLEESLAALQAEMAQVDVDQMLTDVSAMQTQVVSMQADVDAYNEQAEGWLNQINGILADLADLQVIIDNAPTKEQTDALLADVQSVQQQIDLLLLLSDKDADGVINALDQCPDTVLGATVNNVGCSEAQVAAGTASSTTGG